MALITKVPNHLRAARRSGTLTLARLFFLRSEEEKKEQRKEILSEIRKGYFSDLNEFRRTAGKRFEAANHVCFKKDAVKFPALSGLSLSGGDMKLPQQLHGTVSLVLLSLRALGMRMCDLYRQPFSNQFSQQTAVQVCEVTVVEGLLFRLMHRLLERNLKQQVAQSRHGSFMCYSSRFSEARKRLEVHNSIIGYAFLVDRAGRVRWRAHGKPTERELEAMTNCCRQLLKES